MEIKCGDCGQTFHEHEYDNHDCTPDEPMSQRERRDRYNPSIEQ